MIKNNLISLSWHPLIKHTPISVANALKNIIPSNIAKLSPLYLDYWYVCKLGDAMGKSQSDIKLHPDKPSYTLLSNKTGCGKARWDVPRWIAVNEACILQSFPENFKFLSNGSAYRRIGNSVPPLMMKAISSRLLELIPDNNPTVIGLFTGCGGSSLGFHYSGFKELLAIDYDQNATDTFKLNFPDIPCINTDIRKITGTEIMKRTGIKKGELYCLQGSPPCQGFSTSGSRHFGDARNQLYKDMARIVDDIQPKIFVMENVSGMVKSYMKFIFQDCLKTFESCGYTLQYKLMNAQYYRVPQSRKRLILIGIRNDLLTLNIKIG